MHRLEEKYAWTWHVRDKMRYYRLTESRVKRVIRHPKRIEEGIMPGAIAVMAPAEGKRYSEIWVMYVLTRGGGASLRHDSASPVPRPFGPASRPTEVGLGTEASLRVGAISPGKAGRPSKSRLPLSQKYSTAARYGLKKIKIITAWRYPGRAPERDPIPVEILREIKKLL